MRERERFPSQPPVVCVGAILPAVRGLTRAGTHTYVGAMAAPSAEIDEMTQRRGAPVPLYLGFVVFLVAIGYLIASSVGRRQVPAFGISASTRARAADWERTGDTITIDASDDSRWRLVSLASGRALDAHDTSQWTIGVARYRVMVNGDAADAGQVAFDAVRSSSGLQLVGAESLSDSTNAALRHWYRYNFLTHLLEPNGHVYVLRGRDGVLWKLQVVSYYCPGPEAGCLTIRYAPLKN